MDCLDVPVSLTKPGAGHRIPQESSQRAKRDALVAVVRAFENASVPPYRNRIDPKKGLEELASELIFNDPETVTSASNASKTR